MPHEDLQLKIARAVESGPDMRVPQDESGWLDVAFGRFVGYVKLGVHEIIRRGVAGLEDRVRLIFEVSRVRYPSRKGGGPKLGVPLRVRLAAIAILGDKVVSTTRLVGTTLSTLAPSV